MNGICHVDDIRTQTNVQRTWLCGVVDIAIDLVEQIDNASIQLISINAHLGCCIRGLQFLELCEIL